MARRCKSCNTWNEDLDHCVNCGAVISLELQEKLEWEEKRRKKDQEEPEAIELWFHKFQNSPWFLVEYSFLFS